MILFEHNLIFSVMFSFFDVLRNIHKMLSKVINISDCMAIVLCLSNLLFLLQQLLGRVLLVEI